MSKTIKQVGEDTLLGQAFDITVTGLLLTLVMAFIEKRITGQGVVVICCFLAALYIWKLIWPLERFRRYVWWQIFSLIMVGTFSWWLIYTAENTRAGWYRLNVLQERVQTIVKNAPAYVILSDSEGYITATSQNIEFLTGYTSKELLGQQLSVLMRDGPAAKHQLAYDKAIALLRNSSPNNNGWMMQGLVTIGVKTKQGAIVPVKAYAGGIRWSTDIQFVGDIDMFAVLVPVPLVDAMKSPSTLSSRGYRELIQGPPPPPIETMTPIPSGAAVPHNKINRDSDIVRPKD